jgi:hypothetical protein
MTMPRNIEETDSNVMNTLKKAKLGTLFQKVITNLRDDSSIWIEFSAHSDSDVVGHMGLIWQPSAFAQAYHPQA